MRDRSTSHAQQRWVHYATPVDVPERGEQPDFVPDGATAVAAPAEPAAPRQSAVEARNGNGAMPDDRRTVSRKDRAAARPTLVPPSPERDPLLTAVEHAADSGRPMPVTLITGVPAQSAALGPLFSHVAGRLRARRPWGTMQRFNVYSGMVNSILECATHRDLDGAVRYLHTILFPDHTQPTGSSILLPLWNIDRAIQWKWDTLQTLAAVATLAAVEGRTVLHLIATAPEHPGQATAADFDLIVPVDRLVPEDYDAATAAALAGLRADTEGARERDLRLQLPVVQLRRQNDELKLDLHAPDPAGPKGIGALIGKFRQSKRYEQQLADFTREALLVTFRWDPAVQYVHLSVLRETKGARQTLLEEKAERGRYREADETA